MRVGVSQFKRPLCYVMALLYVVAGSLHFVEPACSSKSDHQSCRPRLRG